MQGPGTCRARPSRLGPLTLTEGQSWPSGASSGGLWRRCQEVVYHWHEGFLQIWRAMKGRLTPGPQDQLATELELDLGPQGAQPLLCSWHRTSRGMAEVP